MIFVRRFLLVLLALSPLLRADTERNLDRYRPEAAPADASTAARVALVIGNAAYAENPLKNPQNDADDIAAVLADLGFEVVGGVRIDQTLRQMKSSVRQFRRRLESSGGVGFFYYAGHGVQYRNANYLIPVGADIRAEEDIEHEAMSLDWLLDTMDGAGNRLNVLVLDACRNNPLGRSFVRSDSPGLARVDFQGDIGTLIAYATAAGRTAKDGRGRNSPYARHLKAALQVPGLELTELFKRVGRNVERETERAQRPWRESSVNQSFYFRPAPVGEGGSGRMAPAAAQNAPPAAAPPARVEAVPIIAEGRAAGAVFRDALRRGGRGPQMVVLPTGSFRMGDANGDGEVDEKPVRTVTIRRPIAMGKYEVTFKEYDLFVAAMSARKPGDKGWGRGARPVIDLSWREAQAYAAWLRDQTGKRYRLPSEAEWEYAARAGATTDYGLANCRGCGSRWDNKKTAPVGSFTANAFGLYDLRGNVWEWVEDCYINTYEGAPSDGGARTGGDCFERVLRGGSWYSGSWRLRSTHRRWSVPSNRISDAGFRLVRELAP